MSIAEKMRYFEQLVASVNAIDGIKIDVSTKAHHSHKDALAFFVEQIFRVYNQDSSIKMLTGAIEKIKKYVAEPNNIAARRFLDEQITTLYEAFLKQKIAESSGEEKQQWENTQKIYAARRNANEKDSSEKKPVEFGGIRWKALPNWYNEKYL